MKIAISTEGGSVSAHFGRCPSYTLVEIQDGKVVKREEIPNPGHAPGFLPGYLAERGVTTIIAGGMGPRAQDLFSGNNIETIIGVEGPVDDVIDRFLRGKLEAGRSLCDHGPHHEGPCRHEHETGPAPGPRPLGPGPICISAKGPDLDSELDPHFGRAPYFLFVDPSTGSSRRSKTPFPAPPTARGSRPPNSSSASGPRPCSPARSAPTPPASSRRRASG